MIQRKPLRQNDLQNRIVQILSLNINQIRDIVALCYSGVEWGNRRKYQAAYAAVSRVLRRLEKAGALTREYEIEHFYFISAHDDKPSSHAKSGGRWRRVKLNVAAAQPNLTSGKLNVSHR